MIYQQRLATNKDTKVLSSLYESFIKERVQREVGKLQHELVSARLDHVSALQSLEKDYSDLYSLILDDHDKKSQNEKNKLEDKYNNNGKQNKIVIIFSR